MLSNRVQIERDNKVRSLEDTVFNQLADIVKPELPKDTKANINTVSVEDALRELLEIEKSQRDRTAG